MSLRKKLLANASFETIGEAVATLVGALFFVVLTRKLGAVGVGQFSFVQSLMLFVALGLDSGTSQFFFRKWSKESDEDKIHGDVGAWLSFKLVAFVPLAIIITLYGSFIENALLHPILLGLFIFFLDSLIQVPIIFMQARDRFLISNKIKILDKSLLFLFPIITLFFYQSVTGVFLAMLTGRITILVFLNFYLIKSSFAFRLSKFSLWEFFSIIKQSIFLFFQMIMGLIYIKIDVFFIKYMIGEQALGLYSSGYRLLELGALVPSIMLRILFPTIVKAVQTESKQQVNALYQKIFKIHILIGVYFSFMIFIFAKTVILLLFGDAFAESILILQILSSTLLIKFLFLPAYNFLIAQHREKECFIFLLISCLVNFALNGALIPYFGIKGAAIATIISEAILGLTYLRKVYLRHDLILVLKLFIIVGLLYLGNSYLDWSVWIRGALVTITFVGLLFGIRVISLQELKSEFSFLQKKG